LRDPFACCPNYPIDWFFWRNGGNVFIAQVPLKLSNGTEDYCSIGYNTGTGPRAGWQVAGEHAAAGSGRQQQAAGSRQQQAAAGSRQQAAGSRQQAAGGW